MSLHPPASLGRVGPVAAVVLRVERPLRVADALAIQKFSHRTGVREPSVRLRQECLLTASVCAMTTDSSPRPWRARGKTTLLVLTTLLAVVAAVTVWARSQALDTDEWVDLSSDLLAEPEVQESLAEHLVDKLYTELNVAEEVEAGLPDDFGGVASLLAGALRGPATDTAERVLASDAVATVWEQANRTTHATFVALVRDETPPGVSSTDGEVALELRELMQEVGAKIGLSGNRLDQLPEDAGRIVIFDSDQLDAASSAIAILDFLSWFLVVLVAAMYIGVVFLAEPADRVRTVGVVGASLVAAGLVLIIVRAIAIRSAIAVIVENPGNHSVANIAAYVSTSLLAQIAWTGVAYGVMLMAASWLLGKGKLAIKAQRFVAPAFNAEPLALWGGTVAVLLVALWWSPGRSFQSWVSVLLLVVLVVLGVLALRRRTTTEWPDASWSDSFSRSVT